MGKTGSALPAGSRVGPPSMPAGRAASRADPNLPRSLRSGVLGTPKDVGSRSGKAIFVQGEHGRARCVPADPLSEAGGALDEKRSPVRGWHEASIRSAGPECGAPDG